MKPLLKYTLLQVPDVLLFGLVLCALRAFFGLPDRVAWLLLGIWIAAEVGFYPFVRRALAEGGQRSGASGLLGAEGIVEESLDPRGWVRVRGELWQAHSSAPGPVPVGARVRVCGVSGLTLCVEPAGPPDSRKDPRET